MTTENLFVIYFFIAKDFFSTKRFYLIHFYLAEYLDKYTDKPHNFCGILQGIQLYIRTSKILYSRLDMVQ